MNCEKIKEKLSLYIDNLLEPDEADEIKRHIEGCENCRGYYNKLLKLGEMVDDFEISDKEEYWESQKEKVMEQIENVESGKIIEVQPVRKRYKLYKYLAVAASLALVAFVSIYESQEFHQTRGLFDDSRKETTTEQVLDRLDAEDVSIEPDQTTEVSDEFNAVSDKADDTKSVDDLSSQKIPEPALAPEKRIERSRAVIESEKKEDVLESPKAESIKSGPGPQESSLELGEPIEISFGEDLQAVSKPTSISSHSVNVEPLSFESTKVETQEGKILSDEEIPKGVSKDFEKSDFDYDKSAMTFESDEGKDNFPELRQDKDSIAIKINIYKIRLDSLEKEHAGIYSPHYRESSAKGRDGVHPDSLNTVILELAETCYQVGILTTEEQEREDMISKLRRLSIHGNPESIEKIQRYIVSLLAAD